MRRQLIVVLSTATAVAALGLSGCAHSESRSSPSAPAALSPVAVPQAPPVPPPEALTDVLYRLADPAVPGSEKLSLVEGATPESAVILDKFVTALHDGGYLPMSFHASEIGWSDTDPADVVAAINVNTHNPAAGRFSFPMEFRSFPGGWQLSRKTADMLLAFGDSRVRATPAPTG